MKRLEDFIGKRVKIVFKDNMVKKGILAYDSKLGFYSVIGSGGVAVFTEEMNKKIKAIK